MKKVLSLMLVLVLVLGMSTVAFAAVKKYDPKSSTHAVPDYTDIDLDEIVIQDVTNFDFWVEFDFTNVTGWNSADLHTNTPGTLVKGDEKNSKITVRTTVKKGSAAVDTVELDDLPGSLGGGGSSNGAIRALKLALNDELKNTSDDGVEFEVRSYLVVDGKHWNDQTVTWVGFLKNEIDDNIDSDYEYFFMGNGTVAKPTEYIKSIELDLDNGVSVFAKMFKDKKYWAVSDDEATDDQEIIMDKYGIDGVYNLRNIGLATVTDYVLLDEDSDMFVYDGNFKYLGKGSDKLPWSDTYYLAAKQLDIDEDDEPIDDEDGDDPELPEDLGGDDDYPANVNDNPGTGC